MTGLVALLNPLVARFVDRYGRIAAIVTGQLLMALGLAGLYLLPSDAPTLLVAFLMVPVGVGGSFTVPPIIALVMDHAPAELAGTASGAVNTARQLGGSLGVAVFGAALAGQDFMAGLRISLGTTALFLLVLVVACLPLRHAKQSRHWRKEDTMKLVPTTPTAKAPKQRFAGDVYLNSLHNGEAPSRLVAAMVRFTPGARTNWHSHPLGQTLHCTDGIGLVATRDGSVVLMRPGDTVHTPPGEEHWHGATRDNMMCHLALVEHDNGESATWLEPVSDQDYEAAHAQTSR